MSEFSARGARVLVIDGGDGLARTVCTILRDMGVENILIANSGPKVREALGRRQFDLIIGNLAAPDFEAASFARVLRNAAGAAKANVTTPLIVIGERADQAEISAALDAGVTSYQSGNFTPGDLRDRIIDILKTR